MPSSTFITFEQLQVPFPRFSDISPLQLSILSGEQIAIIGSDEAEKNAFLELLAGKIKPKSGLIRYSFAEAYMDKSVEDKAFKSVYDLVSFVRMHHHFRNKSNTQTFYYQQRFNSDDAARVDTVIDYLAKIPCKTPNPFWTPDKALSILKLTHLAQESLIKLSNGETRRLMLAAALVKNPKLLLLDRPLTGLDQGSRAGFNEILTEILNSGIQLIMQVARHEIPSCITHILQIEQGRYRYFPKDTLPSELHPTVPPAGLTENQHTELVELIRLQPERTSFDALIRMNNVNISYGEKKILDQICWTVLPREVWALHGHNGAGKSTLLSLINGDHPQAYRNDLWLFGKKRGSGESIWDIKRQIGYVSPEFHQFFPKNQTCMQVILSGFFDTAGLFRQPSESQRAIGLRWLQLMGLEAHRTHRLATLAPDQQRLCLLARALIKNPPLLILDEPVQGLSAFHRDFFKSIIDTVSEHSDTAIIYVSHYAEDLPACINRVLHLREGKVISNTDD